MRYCALDIETTGLNFAKDKITYIGAYDGDNYIILPNPSKKDFIKLKQFCGDAKLIWHNGTFDTSFIKVQFGLTLPIDEDTMIIQHTLDSTSKKSLKYLATTLLGVEDWDVSLKTKTSVGEEAEQYFKYDLLYTYKLFEVLSAKLVKPHDKKLYNELMLPLSLCIRDMQSRGIHLNMSKLQESRREIMDEIDMSKKQLDTIAQQNGMSDINWNSSIQLAVLFYDKLKLPILGTTNSGKPSTNSSVMKKLGRQSNHPILGILASYKQATRELSFIDSWLEKQHNGRLYPHFNATGTSTGRLSSSEPNLQQVPRSKRLRMIFDAPPGKQFVEADFSQVELRVAGYISGDKNIIQAYLDGEDLHTKTARMFNDPPTKEDRTKAKSMNFGLLYGMSAKTYKEYALENYEIVLTTAEATKIRAQFFRTYPGLTSYYNKVETRLSMHHKLVTPFGRVRHFPEMSSTNKYDHFKAFRAGYNFPVQSTAADLLYSAIIELNKKGYQLVGTVHDSLLFEIDDNTDVEQLKSIMERPELVEQFGIQLPLPIVADIEIGAWGSK